MRTRLVLLACLAALAGVAGCGGGGGDGEGARLSKQEYLQQVNAIGERLRDEFSAFQDASPSDLKEISALMNELGEALDKAAAEFADLEPPEEVQGPHDKFVAAARDLAEKAREVAGKVENASGAELLDAEFQETLDISKSEAFKDLQEADAEFKAKGYDFESFGG